MTLPKLLVVEDNFYIIKEQNIIYRYISIDHHPTDDMPIVFRKRIIMTNEDGENRYVPAIGFEGYELSEE